MDHSNYSDTPFLIDNWEVLPQQNRLVKEGKNYPVEPKVMQVLLCLAARAPEPVSRDEIFEDVWEGNYVSDNVLSRSISVLRSIFGDNPRQPTYIETIPKHGYALLITPTWGESESKAESEPSQAEPQKSGLPVHPLLIIAAVFLFLFGFYLMQDREPAVRQIETRPVTSFNGHEISPRVSPDGKSVVFLARSGQSRNTDIYITDLNGSSNPIRLTEDESYEKSPVWSPDGKQIAFLKYTGDSDCGIYIIDRWGESEQHITPCDAQLYSTLDWSPSGDQLAYTSRETEAGPTTPAIYLYTISSESNERLTHPSDDIFGDFSPHFSSDGEQITFLRSIKEGVGALITKDLNTGETRTHLRDDHYRIYGFDWYEEGKSLIFSSNRKGQYGLWKYQLTDQTYSTLMPGGYLLNPAVVQRDPTMKIIYEEWKFESNIYQLDVTKADEPAQPLIASSRMDFQPSLSPANDKIVFLSDRSGKRELWIADQDGSNLRSFQTDIELMMHSPVLWSPEGDKLVFAGLPGESSQIFVADLFAGNVQQITTGGTDKLNPSWSSDGQWVYYSNYESGEWHLYRQSLKTGKKERIAKNEHAFFAQESKDSEHLFYVDNQSKSMHVLELDSKSQSRNIAQIKIDPDHFLDWRVTTSGLYYIGINDSRKVLYRYQLEPDQTKPIHTFKDGSLGKGLAIDADSGKLLFVKVEQSSSDLVLLEQK